MVALLLQHVGVTLVALSVIRERTRGSAELFAVTPVRPGEILLGKALSFGHLLGVLAGLLLGVSIIVLGVPLLGNVILVAVTIGLLGVVSLALGFVVAALSATEAQAVQLAMLTLLLAVFFGGLFVPLESIAVPVRVVSFAVPVTYAGEALRAVLLRDDVIPLTELSALALMAVILVPLAVLLTRRSYRLD